MLTNLLDKLLGPLHTHPQAQSWTSDVFAAFLKVFLLLVELSSWWVELNSWCLIFFSREVKEESSSFRFCKEMIVDEFVEIFWISWIGVDSRVVAPQLQASSC